MRSIVITGASRGIGEALARAYAEPGVALALLGRDEASLERVAEACRARGAEATALVADVRDRERMRTVLAEVEARRPIDLAIANAGVALPADSLAEMESATWGEIDVNLMGTLNTILPIVAWMSARRAGQLALVSSLAALVPLPSSPGYSATKAALLVYGLALRERLRGHGLRVSVVCPGYVATEMGERYKGARPLEITPDAAARRIRRGLERDRAVIAFPQPLAMIAKLSTFVPERVRRLGLSGFRFSIDEG